MTLKLRPPDLVNLHGVETGRDHLSQTSLKTFLTCQQQFSWNYEHRLTPAVSSTPLAIGRGFAHALELGDPDEAGCLIRAEAREEADRADGNPWITAPSTRDIEV